MESHGDVLRISGVSEINAHRGHLFRDQVRGALTGEHRAVEIDCAGLHFIDSCGIGALVAIHKAVCGQRGWVRLLNPNPGIRELLERVCLHRLFQIV
jgi:anti-anti-sigma factor